jgi:hypothetical protein
MNHGAEDLKFLILLSISADDFLVAHMRSAQAKKKLAPDRLQNPAALPLPSAS